jgi:antirestriction protein ArdC
MQKTSEKLNLYQIVTERIVANLEKGVIPWEKPWKSPKFAGGVFPRNFSTGERYRGINVMLLWSGLQLALLVDLQAGPGTGWDRAQG